MNISLYFFFYCGNTMVFFEVPNHGNHSIFCHLSNYHSIAIWFTDTMISPQYSFVKDVVFLSRRLALAPDWGVCSCLEVRMSRVISSPGTRGLLFTVCLTLTQGCLSRPCATHPKKQRENKRFHLLSPSGSFTANESDVSIKPSLSQAWHLFTTC